MSDKLIEMMEENLKKEEDKYGKDEEGVKILRKELENIKNLRARRAGLCIHAMF